MTPATAPPPPKRSASTAWIIISIILVMGCGLATGVFLIVRSTWRSLTERNPPAPVAPIAALVTRHAGGDETIYRVDWTLAPAPREHCFASVDGEVQVDLPDGGSAEGADVIGLWGTDLGKRTRVDHSSANVDVWPCREGTLHVYAQLEGTGAAEIPCTHSYETVELNHPGSLRFRCKGTLDPKSRLALPPPPTCNTDALTPLFDLIAPGACFGLSALELSHLPYPAIHVSTTGYEDFRPWPSRSVGAPRFEIPLGGVATSLTLDETGKTAAELYPKLIAIFAGESYLPTCDADGSTQETWTTPLAAVTLRAELAGCDPHKAVRLDLKVKRRP